MNIGARATWLESLQPGAKAIIEKVGYRNTERIGTIARLTARLFIFKDGEEEWRFRRADGREYGKTSYAPHRLQPCTDEDALLIKATDLQNEIFEWARRQRYRLSLEHLTADQCKDVLACLVRNGLLERKSNAT